jgi:2-aminoethylphosphonate-pyruvate transaminase
MRSRGFTTAIPDREASCTMSTFSLPESWSYDRLFDAFYQRGFVIYACKGEFRERYFQVSTMGEVTDEHIETWLAALDEVCAIEPAAVGSKA